MAVYYGSVVAAHAAFITPINYADDDESMERVFTRSLLRGLEIESFMGEEKYRVARGLVRRC